MSRGSFSAVSARPGERFNVNFLIELPGKTIGLREKEIANRQFLPILGRIHNHGAGGLGLFRTGRPSAAK
jgi:hypothetical protein